MFIVSKNMPVLDVEEFSGTRFLCKKVLRSRRTCITRHRIVSMALSLTTHVGATPSGPEPSGKNSNIFNVKWKFTDLSCADAQISHSCPLRRKHLGVFGKGVQVHWAWGQQCASMPLACDYLNACTKALLAVRGAPFAKGFSPWRSTF
jgi:hypothetical protein